MPRHSFTRAHTVCQCVSYLSNHAERIITVASSYSHIVDVTNVNRNDEHNDAGRRIRKEKKRRQNTHKPHAHMMCVRTRRRQRERRRLVGWKSTNGLLVMSFVSKSFLWIEAMPFQSVFRLVYSSVCMIILAMICEVKWAERMSDSFIPFAPPIPSHISFIQALQHTFVCLQLLSSYSNSSFCFSSSSQFSHLHRLWKIWM